jgi:hypothetical protein
VPHHRVGATVADSPTPLFRSGPECCARLPLIGVEQAKAHIDLGAACGSEMFDEFKPVCNPAYVVLAERQLKEGQSNCCVLTRRRRRGGRYWKCTDGVY